MLFTDKVVWGDFEKSCLLVNEIFPSSRNVNEEAASIPKIIKTAANQNRQYPGGVHF